MVDPYEPGLRELIEGAFARVGRRLEEAGPTLAVETGEWMRSLTGTGPASTYFLHERAFPMLLLPWWLEGVVRETHDPAFDADVVYSTITGYYFVRMIDDLMDGEHQPSAQALPALIFFHTEFEGAYRPHFPHDDPFWEALDRASFSAAETASWDAGSRDIDRAGFIRISGRKIAGARIPIAAVCHRYGRADLLAPWSEFVDLLGCWHQMLNDMFDWNRDLGQGRKTYFLSEAARQSPALATAEWVMTDGLPWGFTQLDGWMAQLLVSARDLGCPPLVAYLEQRRGAVERDRGALIASLETIRHLARALR